MGKFFLPNRSKFKNQKKKKKWPLSLQLPLMTPLWKWGSLAFRTHATIAMEGQQLSDLSESMEASILHGRESGPPSIGREATNELSEGARGEHRCRMEVASLGFVAWWSDRITMANGRPIYVAKEEEEETSVKDEHWKNEKKKRKDEEKDKKDMKGKMNQILAIKFSLTERCALPKKPEFWKFLILKKLSIIQTIRKK